MKVVILVFVLLGLSFLGYSAEEVVLLPFFTYGKNGELMYIQNEYCYGVPNSVFTFLRFLPNFNFADLDMIPKVTNLDINEVMKVYGSKDKYIIGVTRYGGGQVEYEIFIYGKEGELRDSYRFKKSDEDLFESVDEISIFLSKSLVPDFKKFGYVVFRDFRLGDKELVLYLNDKEFDKVGSGYRNRLRVLGGVKHKFELKDKVGKVFASQEKFVEPGDEMEVSFELKGLIKVGEVGYKERGKEREYLVYFEGVLIDEKTNILVEAEKNYLFELRREGKILMSNRVYVGNNSEVYVNLEDDEWGRRVRFILGSGISVGMGYLGVEYFIGRYFYGGFGFGITDVFLPGGIECVILTPGLEVGYVWLNDLKDLLNIDVFFRTEVMTFLAPGLGNFGIAGILPSIGIGVGIWQFYLRVGGRIDFSILKDFKFVEISPVVGINFRL